MILPQNELSDYSKITTELEKRISVNEIIDTYNWNTPKDHFKWENRLNNKFSKHLSDSLASIEEIRQRIEVGLIDSSGKLIQTLFINAAEKTFDQKKQEKIKLE